MAFGATLDITVNSIVKTLNRINQDDYGSHYKLRTSTERIELKIRHTSRPLAAGSTRKINRHNVEVSYVILATATTPEYASRYMATYEHPDDADPTTTIQQAVGCMAYVGNTTRVTDLVNELN